VRKIPRVVGKFASSGTKVGGKTYRDAIATTNDAYCPSLPRTEGTRLPEGVKCVYEVIVSGLVQVDLEKAMRIGIDEATKVEGILGISTANYGGNLGKGRIYLRSLFDSST
jgi:formylmethanofuran--tetrahydromethanopterin N-formyltransferase